MIPRKLAKRLLAEYIDRLARAEEERGEFDLGATANELLAESDLVLRGAENVEQKARRYLTEGRIAVEQITDAGLIVASARGSAGERYRLGYDPAKREWRCTCPVVRARCSHLAALQLVVAKPS